MIHEEFVKDNRIIDKNEEEKNLELIISLMKKKKELKIANKNFEYAEAELIDYYAYQIKANQAKLDYLVKKAKHRGLALDMIEEIYLRNYKVV